MIKYSLSLLVLGIWALVLSATPPEVTPEYKIKVNQNLRVIVKGKDVEYKTTFKDEEAFFDQFVSIKEGELRFVFQAQKAGVYYITFWTLSEKGSGVTVQITVEDAAPPVPPKPPTPPVPPKPDVPLPTTDLIKKINDSFLLDKGEKADAVQLAALYRQAAQLVMKKVDGKYDIPSSRELLRRVRESSATLIGIDVLTNVRTTAAQELSAVLCMPSDTDLTYFQRQVVSDTFFRLAGAIDALHP